MVVVCKIELAEAQDIIIMHRAMGHEPGPGRTGGRRRSQRTIEKRTMFGGRRSAACTESRAWRGRIMYGTIMHIATRAAEKRGDLF